MTKNTPRIFISLLLMLLCIGIFPVSAFASSGDYPDDTLPAVESSAADTQETKQIGTVTTNGGNLNGLCVRQLSDRHRRRRQYREYRRHYASV